MSASPPSCGSDLSPLAWGIPPPGRDIINVSRFIPTRVGNTVNHSTTSVTGSSHSRETLRARCCSPRWRSSSPLAWEHPIGDVRPPLRSSSPLAGNRAIDRPLGSVGSSPLAWGTLLSAVQIAWTGSSPLAWERYRACTLHVFWAVRLTRVGNTQVRCRVRQMRFIPLAWEHVRPLDVICIIAVPPHSRGNTPVPGCPSILVHPHSRGNT